MKLRWQIKKIIGSILFSYAVGEWLFCSLSFYGFTWFGLITNIAMLSIGFNLLENPYKKVPLIYEFIWHNQHVN